MTPKLGETSTDHTLIGKRDASHCAHVLVRSDEPLEPAAGVRFTDKTCTKVKRMTWGDQQGIVDPFLHKHVWPGELFWVFLLPELVHGMHHEFQIGEELAIGDDTPFDEEEADNERNTYVGRGRGDDRCSGSWCDDH